MTGIVNDDGIGVIVIMAKWKLHQPNGGKPAHQRSARGVTT